MNKEELRLFTYKRTFVAQIAFRIFAYIYYVINRIPDIDNDIFTYVYRLEYINTFLITLN